MNRREHRQRYQNGGFVLITSVFALVLMVTFTQVGLMRSMNVLRGSNFSTASAGAFQMAEAGLEQGLLEFRQKIYNLEDPATSTPCPTWSNNLDLGNPQDDARYCIEATGAAEKWEQDSKTGLFTRVTDYRIRARATVASQNITRQVAMTVQRHLTPVFQYEAFYNGDLEIAPGQDMTIAGRVFTNSNLYVLPNSEITFDSKSIDAVGDFFVSRKNGPQETVSHDISISSDGGNSFTDVPDSPENSSFLLDSRSASWKSMADSLWGVRSKPRRMV